MILQYQNQKKISFATASDMDHCLSEDYTDTNFFLHYQRSLRQAYFIETHN